MSAKRLLVHWFGGGLLGTLIIAITSPLFVRSYLPRQLDATRGVWTLPPEHHYRWRSEGYADSWVGPLGIVGKAQLGRSDDRVIRIAIWGDSQAEGVCLADRDKLHALVESAGEGRLDAYPLARSGDDLRDWLAQMPPVESALEIDWHVLLVAELSDLAAAAAEQGSLAQSSGEREFQASLARRLPAFVIQTGRNLLTEADEQTRRGLRFSVGPVDRLVDSLPAVEVSDDRSQATDWPAVISTVRDRTEREVIIVYAPPLPEIIAGEIRMKDRSRTDFLAMRAAAVDSGIRVIDMTQPFRAAAESGHWPHGFHNGYIGVGHLNADGYRVIAQQIVNQIRSSAESRRLCTRLPLRPCYSRSLSF